MEKKRSIEDIRKSISGRIYIYLANEQIGKQFLIDAESEGYHFGSIKPTDNSWSDIIALGPNKQLSYVGFVGHICFQCNGGSNGNLTRIDYEKYLNGYKDFLFRSAPIVTTDEL